MATSIATLKKSGGQLSSIEREVSAKDGTTFMMGIHPYRSIYNVIDGVVITFVDITGRRRSGGASEQLGLMIQEGFSEVYVCDGETQRFTNFNSATRAALGYTMDELRRLTLPNIEDRSICRWAANRTKNIDKLRKNATPS